MAIEAFSDTSLDVIARLIGVSISPGATAFTRMPEEA